MSFPSVGRDYALLRARGQVRRLYQLGVAALARYPILVDQLIFVQRKINTIFRVIGPHDPQFVRAGLSRAKLPKSQPLLNQGGNRAKAHSLSSRIREGILALTRVPMETTKCINAEDQCGRQALPA